MKIGIALKQLRKELLLRQNKVASGIGITQTYLSQIESNDKEPSMEVIRKIGNYYNVPLAIILWKAIEQTDIREDKQQVFLYVKPLIDNLIAEII